MRFVPRVLAVLVLATVAAVAPARGQNLVANATFDADVAGWAASSDDVQVVWRDDIGSDLVAGSGPGAAEVRHAFWNGGASGVSQEVAVTGAATYRLAASMRRPGLADNPANWVAVVATWQNEIGSTLLRQEMPLPLAATDDVWMREERTWTAPSDARSVRIQLAVGNPADDTETSPGIALFDDVVLLEEGADTARQLLFLPAAAKADGAAGTSWRTTLLLANLVDMPVTVSAGFLAQGRDNQPAMEQPVVLVTVPARGAVIVDDLVGALGESQAVGGVGLVAEGEGADLPAELVTASSSTWTPDPGGNGGYGQGIAAVTAGERGRVVSPGVRHGSSYRSNVGALNTSEHPVSVSVAIHDRSGAVIGSATWNLLPYEHRQQSVASLGAGSVDGGVAVFSRGGAAGSVRAYLSVVDQVSGDAVYVEAR